MVFDPEAMKVQCRRDLPAALRQLAEHLERGEMTGSLWDLKGNGMVQDWRRAHFLMTLDLAVLMGPSAEATSKDLRELEDGSGTA